MGKDSESPIRLARAVNLMLELVSLRDRFSGFKLVRTEQKPRLRRNLCYG